MGMCEMKVLGTGKYLIELNAAVTRGLCRWMESHIVLSCDRRSSCATAALARQVLQALIEDSTEYLTRRKVSKQANQSMVCRNGQALLEPFVCLPIFRTVK